MSKKTISEDVYNVRSPRTGVTYEARVRYEGIEVEGRYDEGATVTVQRIDGRGSSFSRYVDSTAIGLGGINDAILGFAMDMDHTYAD